jgi:hypothetical protein
MSGIARMSEWELEKYDRKRKVVKTMAKTFPYTSEGCYKARQFLTNRGQAIISYWTGWDIVYHANNLIIEDKMEGMA